METMLYKLPAFSTFTKKKKKTAKILGKHLKVLNFHGQNNDPLFHLKIKGSKK
jgi:hypothetical protein